MLNQSSAVESEFHVSGRTERMRVPMVLVIVTGVLLCTSS